MKAEDNQELIERCKTISSWREKYGDFANVMLPAVEAQQVAEIALAALTAPQPEPVHQMRLLDGGENCSEWIEVTEEEFNTATTEKYGKWERRKLYTAPPAPVMQPVKLPENARIHKDWGEEYLRKSEVIKAIRAAGYPVEE